MGMIDTIKENLKWNDILVVGDSFAKQRTKETDWPMYVATSLTTNRMPFLVPLRGQGFSGASWWSTRKVLVKELENHPPKLLIMTHTEMQRIPSDDDYGLNSSSVFSVEEYLEASKQPKSHEYIPKEILLAGQEFYKYLFCRDFFFWAQKQWFQEIDSLVEKYNIPYVVHLHAFEPWFPPIHTFKYGVTFNKPLWDLCDDNKLISKDSYKNVTEEIYTIQDNVWNNNSNRNHFTVENNQKLAKQILSALDNYSNGLRNLQL